MYVHFKISLELKMLKVNCERPNHFFFPYHFITQVRKILLHCKRSNYLATNSLLRAWFNFISSVKGFLLIFWKNEVMFFLGSHCTCIFHGLCLSLQSYLFAQLFVFMISRLKVLMSGAHSLFIWILSTQLTTSPHTGVLQILAESMGSNSSGTLLAFQNSLRISHQIEKAQVLYPLLLKACQKQGKH